MLLEVSEEIILAVSCLNVQNCKGAIILTIMSGLQDIPRRHGNYKLLATEKLREMLWSKGLFSVTASSISPFPLLLITFDRRVATLQKLLMEERK